MHALWKCSFNIEKSTKTYKYPETGLYYCSDWVASGLETPDLGFGRLGFFFPTEKLCLGKNHKQSSTHGNHIPIQFERCYEAVCHQPRQGGRGYAKINGMLLLGTWGTLLCS